MTLPKWKEAIGQSVLYASLANNRIPGIILIVNSRKDHEYLDILRKTVAEYGLPIEICTISDNSKEESCES